MSTAPVPKSCLKPAVRNPWVSEDCGESTSSDGGGAPRTAATHDLHQYAMPFHTSSGSSSQGGGTHPIHTSSSSNSQPCSVAGTHQPNVRGPGSIHGQHHHAQHHHPHQHMVHHHGPPHPSVPHSHTMQSLPEVGNSHGQQMPLSTAHSLHGTLPPPPPPWGAPDHHQMLPPPWAVGAGGQPMAQGLFTVGQEPHWQTFQYNGQHIPAVQHNTLLTQGPVVSQYPPPPRAAELSRCEQCHGHCFRAAQAAFVGGIVTGFSLLVAGGVFHRQHGQHLQVLVYIGALVSLVCVVLLVIFCAMNKDGGRRSGGAALRLAALDPETVPLRQVEVPPVIMSVTDSKHNQNSCTVKGGNPNMCHVANNSGPCIMVPNSQNIHFHGSTNHHTHTTGCLLANQGSNMMATEHQNCAQGRHVSQRSYDEDPARYNHLWKQLEAVVPNTTTATTTHHSSSSTTHKSTSEAITNF